MKKNIITVSALCMLSFGALAQSSRTEPWSGLNLGVNAGYGRGDHDLELLDGNHDSKGAIAGVQAGYSRQFDKLVLGVEADVNTSRIKSSDRVHFAVGSASSTTDIEHRIKNLSTVRAKIGYAAGAFHPYLTGGWASGETKSAATAVLSGFGPLDGTHRGSDTRRHSGWTVGAGVDYAISATLSAKVEYLHVDLGKESYAALPALDPTSRSHEIVARILRVGLNYRF